MNTEQRSFWVKNTAKQLGFEHCGIAVALQLEDDARRLEQWLKAGFHGKMDYMERNFELRTDPGKLVPGAKSIITLLLNYYPEEDQVPEAPKIAKYAYGTDYHFVIRDKLNDLLDLMRSEFGQIDGRGFVDSAPVLERSWAVRSGLGWVGKNGNLITRQTGSFVFIATLITDLDVEPDTQFSTNHCGSCTRCLDSCPTGAIVAPAVIDSRRCISYLTIELKDEFIPSEYQSQMKGWAFGCDICQDVCPWNRFSKPNTEPGFTPIAAILNLTTREWQTMTEEFFNTNFRKSPLKRTKWKGMMRNINASARPSSSP